MGGAERYFIKRKRDTDGVPNGRSSNRVPRIRRHHPRRRVWRRHGDGMGHRLLRDRGRELLEGDAFDFPKGQESQRRMVVATHRERRRKNKMAATEDPWKCQTSIGQA